MSFGNRLTQLNLLSPGKVSSPQLLFIRWEYQGMRGESASQTAVELRALIDRTANWNAANWIAETQP